MYLVKALAAVAFPVVFDGPNVPWSSGQLRLVDDSLVGRYREHTDVFTVVAGPDMGACIQALANDQAGDATGAVAGSGVTAAEAAPVLHTTVLTCTARAVSVADDPGVAQYGGTGKLYDFPEGLIVIHGAVIAGALTLGATGTIINTWSGVVALGTAAAGTGATLTGTEADVMASNAVAAATAKVATIDAVSTALAMLDGTAAAKGVYLNLAVADDATHTAGTGTFTGTVTLVWSKVGDN